MMTSNATPSKKFSFRYGSIAVLVGLIFLLIGLILTGSLLAVAIGLLGEFAFWPRVLVAISAAFPFALAVIGLLLTFAGHVVVIDPLKRQLRIRHGQWLAWRRESMPFAEFDSVELLQPTTEHFAGSDHRDDPVFQIRLHGPMREIDVCDRRDYQKARAVAEQIAAAIEIELCDTTGDELSVRRPQFLDESLRARNARLGEQTTWPEPIATNRFRVSGQPNATVIHIPKPSKKMVREGIYGFIFLLVLYGISLAGTAFYLRNWLDSLASRAGPAWWHPIIYAAPMVALLYVVLPGLLFLLSREEVSISPKALKHTRRFAVGSWTRTIVVDQIEEVLVKGDDVLVRSDLKSLRLGVALEKAERLWLRDAVKFLLVNGPTNAPLP